MDKEAPPSDALGLVNLASPRMGSKINSVSDDFLPKHRVCWQIPCLFLFLTNLITMANGWMAGNQDAAAMAGMTGV